MSEAGEAKILSVLDVVAAAVESNGVELRVVRTEMSEGFVLLDTVEHRFDGLDVRFDGLEVCFGGLERRFGRVETRVEEL